jgi:hypothetical protein
MFRAKEKQMQKKVNKTAKVVAYMKKHPKATPKEISDALGIAPTTVYQIRHNKKHNLVTKMAKLPMTALTGVEASKLVEMAHSISVGRVAKKKVTAEMIKDLVADLKAKQDQDPRMPRFEEAPPKADMVNHPPHYKAGGIEVIDYIESKELGYHLGNVIKYISRAGLKNGKVMEDLQKAQWYLNRAIEFHNKYHGSTTSWSVSTT